MFGQQACVKGGVFLGGEGIAISTNFIECFGELRRTQFGCALEQEMLKEV